MTVGNRIKKRREELGMSAEALGEKIGKAKTTIYRYETGAIENMPSTVLEPIAEALNTTPARLMGWEDQPCNEENPWQIELLDAFDDMKLDDQIYFSRLAKTFSKDPKQVKESLSDTKDSICLTEIEQELISLCKRMTTQQKNALLTRAYEIIEDR